jgi:hypothetical protein
MGKCDRCLTYIKHEGSTTWRCTHECHRDIGASCYCIDCVIKMLKNLVYQLELN